MENNNMSNPYILQQDDILSCNFKPDKIQNNTDQYFLQLNKKLDDIVYQIGILHDEVNDMKKLFTSLPNINNSQHLGSIGPIIYPQTLDDKYHGQQISGCTQDTYKRYSSYFNSFQSNS